MTILTWRDRIERYAPLPLKAFDAMQSEIDDLRAALATTRQENDLLNVKLIELAKINATCELDAIERCASVVEDHGMDADFLRALTDEKK